MKYIKKIIFFISLFVLYLIFKEFLQLYVYMKNVHPYAAYGTLVIIAFVFIFYVVSPIIKILKIPKNYGPTLDKSKESEIITFRIEKFRKNKFLKEQTFDFSKINNDKESYNKILKVLSKQASDIRKNRVSQLFYSTAIAQNGFLDAILILSASINHIKEIFLLYNGRVSNRDLFTIGKKVYYSMAIGGSEGVEYVTEEIFSKFAVDSLKSIPFIDKIFSSIADGFVNAALLTRISYVTENYCKLTYIESEKDLVPSAHFIFNSAKNITSHTIDKLKESLIKMTVDSSINFAMIAVNPIGYVLGKTIDKSDNIDPSKKERLKDHAKLVGNPVVYVMGKLFKSLRKN
ncbi:MAG: hypothetical protein PF570_00520 [Candidatus Cloacimonetes bacterium]|jgi:hypothetical protein|nr:hypothetical protein [Candidatus Cloacimonadota bacterium]